MTHGVGCVKLSQSVWGIRTVHHNVVLQLPGSGPKLFKEVVVNQSPC